MSTIEAIVANLQSKIVIVPTPTPIEFCIGSKTYILANYPDPLATFATLGNLKDTADEAAKLVAELKKFPRGQSTARDREMEDLTKAAELACSNALSHTKHLDRCCSHSEWVTRSVKICSQSNKEIIRIARVIANL